MEQSDPGLDIQLAYMLMHSAILSDTHVRHYPLVETFDAWESWDVLHTVPERLRWGIWAYSHASVKTPHGLEFPGGSYISWANQGKRLLSNDDVHFLATNVDAAVRDAHRTTQVFEPTLVYSRETMQWQMDHASPNNDIKEWIDEQAGSIMKWPVLILSATHLEWLPKVHSDLFILQTPVHLRPTHHGAGLGRFWRFFRPDGSAMPFGVSTTYGNLRCVCLGHSDLFLAAMQCQVVFSSVDNNAPPGEIR